MIDPRTYVTRGLFCGAREIATRGLFTCEDKVIITEVKVRDSSGSNLVLPYQQLELSEYKLTHNEEEEILLIIKTFLYVNR